MAEYSSLLQVFAQVFIAFAGFAGVIAAFSSIRLSPEVTTFRVRSLVAVALFALFAALFPFLPPAFGASEYNTMRIAAIPVAIAMVGISYWIWRQSLPLYRAGVLDTRRFALLEYVIAATFATVFVAVAAGRLVELAPAIYLAALFFGLALCCYYFVLVILAVELRSKG